MFYISSKNKQVGYINFTVWFQDLSVSFISRWLSSFHFNFKGAHDLMSSLVHMLLEVFENNVYLFLAG